MTEWDEGHKACYDEFMRRIEEIKNDIWMKSKKYDFGMAVTVGDVMDIFNKYIPKEN